MVAKKVKKSTAKKTKKTSKTAKKTAKKSVREDIIKLKELPKSVLVEEDLRKLEMKHEALFTGRRRPAYYLKYVLRCTKCIEDFEHSAHIPTIRQSVDCPVCGEAHAMEIIPVSGEYQVKLTDNLEIIGRKNKKKRKRKK